MKKRFIKWLGNLLWPYFVPMEDYDYVQERFERTARNNQDLLDHIYKRFSWLEFTTDEELSCKTIQTYNVCLHQMILDWHVVIPMRHWVTTMNLAEEIDVIKEHVVQRLTAQFHDRIKAKLFK